MATKKNSVSNPNPIASLLKSHKQFKKEIKSRIDSANEIISRDVNTKEGLGELYQFYSKWDDYNIELLKQSFDNHLNEYVSAYNYKPSIIVSSIGGVERLPMLSEQISDIKNKIRARITRLEKLYNKIDLLPVSQYNEITTRVNKKEAAKPNCVFIGHGRNKIWAHLKIYLEEDLKLKTVYFESESRIGESIVSILEKMLDEATFAVLILTAEDETAAGQKRARQNVIHEAGLFQGRLGFKRAILLKQTGTEEFSNVAGLQYIPFDGDNIEATFYRLGKAIEKELKLK